MSTLPAARDLALVLSVLLVVGPAHASLAAAASKPPAPTIQAFTYTGGGVNQSGTQYVWQSANATFDVVVAGGNASGNVSVCLGAGANASASTGPPACTVTQLPSKGRVTATVSLGDRLRNATGNRTVVATLLQGTGPNATVVARKTMQVMVLSKTGDYDDDGLSNVNELTKYHTNPTKADTDGDGLTDGQEVNTYHTNPNKADTDGDGLTDGQEVHTYHTDPNKADTDGDGLSDGQEVNVYHTNPNKKDTDGDGLTDGKEVHVYHTNPNKADTDGDGLSDGKEINVYHTDPNKKDTDGDGLTDGKEVNVYHTNPNKADTDGDGLTDGKEVHVYDTNPNKKDTDGDGLTDGKEVNTYHTDPNKADTDGDGVVDGAEVFLHTNPNKPNPNTPYRALVSTWFVAAGDLGQSPLALVLEAIAAVTLLGVGAIVVGTDAVQSVRDGIRGPRFGDGPPGSGQTATEGTGGPTDDDSGEPLPGAGPGGPERTQETVEDLNLLPAEERVLYLLDRNGGRMRQSDLVDAADWSKATVSRTVSRMEENGDVVKIQLGQTNLITRPDDRPERA